LDARPSASTERACRGRRTRRRHSGGPRRPWVAMTRPDRAIARGHGVLYRRGGHCVLGFRRAWTAPLTNDCPASPSAASRGSRAALLPRQRKRTTGSRHRNRSADRLPRPQPRPQRAGARNLRIEASQRSPAECRIGPSRHFRRRAAARRPVGVPTPTRSARPRAGGRRSRRIRVTSGSEAMRGPVPRPSRPTCAGQGERSVGGSGVCELGLVAERDDVVG
jgi:hypothetical protein